MASHTPVLTCGCGGIAPQTYDAMPEFMVLGNRRPMKVDSLCVPLHWEKGNTDCDAQERRYHRKIASEKKLAKKNSKAAIRQGIQKIGCVPRELLRLRQKQYGKEYLNPEMTSEAELKSQLRSDGLLLTE